MAVKYEPTKESISKHRAPEWYDDAKFGIFIHWSLSSVPGYAVVGRGSIWEQIAERGFEEQEVSERLQFFGAFVESI